MAGRTDAEWDAIIKTKLTQISSEGNASQAPPSTPFSSIRSSADPRFPRVIDHTLLKPDATPAQIDKLCDEALQYGFKSCCVNGIHIPQVAKRLEGSSTIPCCVVNFPLGASSSEVVAFETKQAIASGALEIDTVIPLSLLLSKSYAALFASLHSTVVAASPLPLKVILETVFLSTEQKVAACVVAKEAGAKFVKTSTGFLGGGADKDDVKLMYQAVNPGNEKSGVSVKASGGVRTFEKCLEMLQAGAERIGTSSGVSLMQAEGVKVTPAGTY